MNAIVVGLATLLLAVAVSAQDWPTKPLGIVVPFAPGGSSDVFGRTVAQHRQSSKLIGRPTMSLSAVVASALA